MTELIPGADNDWNASQQQEIAHSPLGLPLSTSTYERHAIMEACLCFHHWRSQNPLEGEFGDRMQHRLAGFCIPISEMSNLIGKT